jgi:release factor glutamine methyltransferase
VPDLSDSLTVAKVEIPPQHETIHWDAIVSNPPYVPTADRDTLHPQVRDYEPAAALFAGPSGLDIYRRLIPQALAALKPNGLLALEIGHGQCDAVAALLANWNAVRFIDDLHQIPRVALARKR